MGFSTSIDFGGNKNKELETTCKDNYKLTLLITMCGDGQKLAPVIFLKGEHGKTIETNMRKLSFSKNNNMCTYYTYESLSPPFHDFRQISN